MSIIDSFKNKKVYGIFDCDLDGVSACIVYKTYIEPVAQTSFITLTGKRDMSELDWAEIQLADTILFADIAPTLDVYVKLIELNKEVFIFDHHVSSYDILHNYVCNNYFYTTEKCGTKILFDAVREGIRVKRVIAQYCELVDVYDRWQQQSLLWKEAKDLHNIKSGCVNYFKVYESEYEKNSNYINRQMEKFDNAKQFYFTEYEKSLAIKGLQKEKDNYDEAKKNMSIRKDNSGNTYAYIEASSKISLICNTILQEYADKLDYIVAHSTFLEKSKNEKNGKLSLRSQGEFDVSIIAEIYKHGGHKNAAGLELELPQFYDLRKGAMHLI